MKIRLTSFFVSLLRFGVAFIGSYFPSGTARASDEEPSTNSTGGGKRLLKASRSFEGRYWRLSSDESWFGENTGWEDGYSGEASIFWQSGTGCQRWRDERKPKLWGTRRKWESKNRGIVENMRERGRLLILERRQSTKIMITSDRLPNCLTVHIS